MLLVDFSLPLDLSLFAYRSLHKDYSVYCSYISNQSPLSLLQSTRSLILICLCIAPVADADDTKRFKNPVSSLWEMFPDSTESAERVNTYQIKQIVRLSDIDLQAKSVRMWISVPSDEAHQKLLNLSVDSAPGKWKFVRDADRRGQFLLIEVATPACESINVAISFTIKRYPVHVTLEPSQVGPMDDALKGLLAEHLILDAPHMEVTKEFQVVADARTRV